MYRDGGANQRVVVCEGCQNGTIHHYRYDNLGRLLQDRVTTLANGIDASVRKIATAYDLIGNVESVTSFNLSGGVFDQILYEYDECGLLCREFHATDGPVDFVVTPCITCTYDKTKGEDLFLKNFRMIFVTYPSGRVIGCEYGTANSEADRLNRCTAIKDGAVTLATYTHLGVSSPMKVTYNQPGLVLDYTASGALDRFGRVTEHAWKKGASNVARIKHGYDRLGNRLYREDGVGVNRDELYSYDESNQLLGMERGKLNATKNAVTNKNFAENFVFDATGNWLVYERDDNGDQIWDLSQTRTHNKANEITCLDSSHANVTHDRNGNMVKMPKPNDWNAAFTCVYDAWNRLVQVKDGNTVTATYKYNGLNQRVKKTVGTTVTQSVFNRNWQELESKIGNAVTTYVWGLRYIDDLVCRDRGSERIYAIHDPNWNVVALCNTSGTAQERIAYNAFGKPTFLDVNHGLKTTSGYSWNRTFTGQVYDSETGLMLYRNRFYHPELGRFATRDPIGYDANDVNVYRYTENSPGGFIDVFGYAKCTPWRLVYQDIIVSGSAMTPDIDVSPSPLPVGDCLVYDVLCEENWRFFYVRECEETTCFFFTSKWKEYKTTTFTRAWIDKWTPGGRMPLRGIQVFIGSGRPLSLGVSIVMIHPDHQGIANRGCENSRKRSKTPWNPPKDRTNRSK